MALRPSVLVVEDDRKTADWLRVYLEQAGCDVRTAHDGRDAVAEAARRRPDVVLLDLMLPGLSGLDVCRQIRDSADTPILMITARSAEDDRLRGFAAGADDYITKPFSPREVVARVRAVLRRAAPPDPASPIVWRDCALDPRSHELRIGASAAVRLTAVESRLLAALLRSPRRVFSRAQLLQRLFGGECESGDRTVDVHVKNLRRKLASAEGDTKASRSEGDAKASRHVRVRIETIHGEGYRLVGDDDVS